MLIIIISFLFIFKSIFSLAPLTQTSSFTSFLTLDLENQKKDFYEPLSSSINDLSESPITFIDMLDDNNISTEEKSIFEHIKEKLTNSFILIRDEVFATVWGTPALITSLISTGIHFISIALYNYKIAVSMITFQFFYFSFSCIQSPFIRYYIYLLSLLLKCLASPSIFFSALACGGAIGILCWIINKIYRHFFKKKTTLISKNLRQSLQSLGFGIVHLSLHLNFPEMFYPKGHTKNEVLNKYSEHINTTHLTNCESSTLDCSQPLDQQMAIVSRHSYQTHPIVNIQTESPTEQLNFADSLEVDIRNLGTNGSCHIQITHGDGGTRFITIGSLLDFLNSLYPRIQKFPQQPFSIILTWEDHQSDIDWQCLYDTIQKSTIAPHYFPYSLQLGLTIPDIFGASILPHCLIQYPNFTEPLDHSTLIYHYLYAQQQLSTHIPENQTLLSLFSSHTPSFLNQSLTALFFSQESCGSMQIFDELCPYKGLMTYPQLKPWPIPCSLLLDAINIPSQNSISSLITHFLLKNSLIPPSLTTFPLSKELLQFLQQHSLETLQTPLRTVLSAGIHKILPPSLLNFDTSQELFNNLDLYKKLPHKDLSLHFIPQIQEQIENFVKTHQITQLEDIISQGYTVILAVVSLYQNDIDHRYATEPSLLSQVYHPRKDLYPYSINIQKALNFLGQQISDTSFSLNKLPHIFNQSTAILKIEPPEVTHHIGSWNVFRNNSQTTLDLFAPFIQRERIIPTSSPPHVSWVSSPSLNIFMSPSSWGNPQAPLYQLFDWVVFQRKDLYSSRVTFPDPQDFQFVQGRDYSNLVNIRPFFELLSWIPTTSYLINTELHEYLIYHLQNITDSNRGNLIFMNHVSFSSAVEFAFCFNFAEKGQLFASFCQLPSLQQERLLILLRLFFNDISFLPFKTSCLCSKKFFKKKSHKKSFIISQTNENIELDVIINSPLTHLHHQYKLSA